MSRDPGFPPVRRAYAAPTATGIVIGASLRLLGTPLLVVLLMAGLGLAYASGWRLIVRRDRGRIIDV